MRWVFSLLVCTLVLGCTARRRVDGDLVRDIQFQGNSNTIGSGQSQLELKNRMEQGDSPFGATTWPLSYLVTPEPYQPDSLYRDAWRLEVYYGHIGHFDAKSHGFMVMERRPRGKKRGGVVSIVGLVEPGVPSLYGPLTVDWPGTEVSAEVKKFHTNLVRREGFVNEGEIYTLAGVQDTRTTMLEKLQNHSFAYAIVEPEMQAFPEEKRVDVTLHVDSGPASDFGPIQVVGNDKVPLDLVLDTLPFTSGKAYKLRLVQQAQTNLFALGTFSVVNVRPDLSNRARDDVPVVVEVTESKFRTLRLGAQANLDFQTVSPKLSAKLSHTNLLHRLIRASLEVAGGFQTPIKVFRPEPLYSATIDWTYPRVFHKKFDWTARIDVRRELLVGELRHLRIEGGTALAWRAAEGVSFSFGPDFVRYAFPGEGDGGDQNNLLRATFGPDVQNPYLLLTWRSSMVIDWRDDPVATKKGWFYTLQYDQAFPQPLSQYQFSKISGEARFFFRLFIKKQHFVEDVKWYLALRARGSIAIPWPESKVPYSEKSFLGGANDLRGFRLGQVGAYDCVCLLKDREQADETVREADVVRKYLPRGGLSHGVFGVELRRDLGWLGHAVAFVDAGVLADQPQNWIDPSRYRVGGGVGYRYDTAIGPIRLDVAMRPLYAEDQGPVPRGGLGTDFRGEYLGCDYPLLGDRPRAFDLISTFDPSRASVSRKMPVLNLYIGIGEAF